MRQLLLASTNPGKVADYQTLLSNTSLKIIPQSQFSIPEVEETGLTFVENALLKARNAATFAKLPALGDDSGLVVEDLHGAPGLYSARYAGKAATDQENITKLLQELTKIPNATRKAKFYSVIVLVRYPSDPAPIICEGTWEGEILKEPRGKNGFGYLPIFFCPLNQRSGAELNIEERNRINHRGKAFRQLLKKYLEEYPI